ncbi:MAG: hypothetical protein ABI706_17790 [Ilumatobacteraceae bacterium]
MTEPVEIRGSRASTLQVRSTPTVPTIIGGLIAVATVIARMSTGHDVAEIYALAFVASTAGLGFALDDPAAETVAASPTPLARRRIRRVSIAGTITVTTWLVIAGAVATSDTQRFPTYDVIIEVAALAAIALATSALVQRRAQAPGGPTAALVVLVGPAFLYGVVFRDVRVFPSLVPGQDLRQRWIWLGLVAAVVLALASRDPAGRKRSRHNSRMRSTPRRAMLES